MQKMDAICHIASICSKTELVFWGRFSVFEGAFCGTIALKYCNDFIRFHNAVIVFNLEWRKRRRLPGMCRLLLQMPGKYFVDVLVWLKASYTICIMRSWGIILIHVLSKMLCALYVIWATGMFYFTLKSLIYYHIRKFRWQTVCICPEFKKWRTKITTLKLILKIFNENAVNWPLQKVLKPRRKTLVKRRKLYKVLQWMDQKV